MARKASPSKDSGPGKPGPFSAKELASAHASYFAGLHAKFKKGDKTAGLEAIYVSIANGTEMPNWAKKYFLTSASTFLHKKTSSLGKAFGIEDWRQHNAQRDKANAWLIVSEVARIHDAGKGVPLSDGKKHGDGAFSLVSEMYKDEFSSLSPSKVRDMWFAQKEQDKDSS